MTISTGDLVTRDSYDHDVLFRVHGIREVDGADVAILVSSLQGWVADAPLDDLRRVSAHRVIEVIRRELLTHSV